MTEVTEISLFDAALEEPLVEKTEEPIKKYTEQEVAADQLWTIYRQVRRTLADSRFTSNEAYSTWRKAEKKRPLKEVAEHYRSLTTWEDLDKELSKIETLLKKGNYWHCSCNLLRKMINSKL